MPLAVWTQNTHSHSLVLANHSPPSTCQSKVTPWWVKRDRGPWGGWDHTRGEGVRGAQEAERRFRYINLSATVANHRLPLSHHGTLQTCGHLMSWLVTESQQILCLKARETKPNFSISHKFRALTCFNQLIRKSTKSLKDRAVTWIQHISSWSLLASNSQAQ